MIRRFSFVGALLALFFTTSVANAFPVVEDRPAVVKDRYIGHTHDATLISHDLGGDSVLQFFAEAKFVTGDPVYDQAAKKFSVWLRDTDIKVGEVELPSVGYLTVYPFTVDTEKYRVYWQGGYKLYVEGEMVLLAAPEPKLLGQGPNIIYRVRYTWDEAKWEFNSEIIKEGLIPFYPDGPFYPSSFTLDPETDTVFLPDTIVGGVWKSNGSDWNNWSLTFQPLDENGNPKFAAQIMDDSWNMSDETTGDPLICNGRVAKGMWITVANVNGVHERIPLALWDTPDRPSTLAMFHALVRHDPSGSIYFQITATPGGLYRITIDELLDDTKTPYEKYYEPVVTNFIGGNDWVGEPVFPGKFAPPGSPARDYIMWQRGIADAKPPGVVGVDVHPYYTKHNAMFAVNVNQPQHVYFLGEEPYPVQSSNSNVMPPPFDTPLWQIWKMFNTHFVTPQVQQYAHRDLNPCAPEPPASWLFAPFDTPVHELDFGRINGGPFWWVSWIIQNGYPQNDPRYCWALNDPGYCNYNPFNPPLTN